MADKYKFFFDIKEVFEKKENSQFNEVFFEEMNPNFNLNLYEPYEETVTRWTDNNFYDLSPDKISKIFSQKNVKHEKLIQKTKRLIDEKMRLFNLHKPIISREFAPVEEFFRSILENQLKNNKQLVNNNSFMKMIKQDIERNNNQNNDCSFNQYENDKIEFNPDQYGKKYNY